jgi:hypothetical protein
VVVVVVVKTKFHLFLLLQYFCPNHAQRCVSSFVVWRRRRRRKDGD